MNADAAAEHEQRRIQDQRNVVDGIGQRTRREFSIGERVRVALDRVDPLERKPWGLRQFTVQDLDGNLFYFHHD